MTYRLMRACLLAGFVLAYSHSVEAKEHSRFVTAAMRANASANVQKFDWAREQQNKAVEAAEPWVARPDDELWAMIPSQELPRTMYSTAGILYEGQKPCCPGCGEAAPAKFGQNWWTWNSDTPWKVRCMQCGEVYPKNDFEAFYRSSLDEHGMFRRALGDRTLLVNSEHAGADDPLRTFGVDDGYGMRDGNGVRHDVIAYCAFMRWREIQKAVSALASAYALTSDARYAHKAAVLLDRVADVYPEMDYAPLAKMGFQHSQGGTGRGRIEGCIWETFVTQEFARSYDVIFDGIRDDKELTDFCAGKAQQNKLGDKSSISAICGHIQEHFLLEALRSVKDGRIDGNTGMTHCSLATSAIALDDPALTREWLDWLFAPGFPGINANKKDPVPWVLTEGLDRDGMGGECGGYGLIWTTRMQRLVGILAAYPEYKHDLVENYPKLRQSFLVESRLNVLDAMMPNTGDTGAVGAWGRRGAPATYLLGYRLYRDPRFAFLAWREHETYGASLRQEDDIFLEDPDAAAREVDAAAKQYSTKRKSEHFGRYGQASLETEKTEDGRAVYICYGQGLGHSHHDCLNIGLLAKNMDMIPDQGYPEYTGTWPERLAWTSNTISHNTLQIGDGRSARSPGGKLEIFAVEPPLRVLQANAPNAYPGVNAYRRTVLLVDVGEDDSYVLDIFRAQGGTNHRLSWHGSGPAAEVNGFVPAEQGKGTFAGSDVPFEKLDGDRGEFFRESGFTYLYDVARSPGPVATPYTVDWRMEDTRGRITEGHEPHLRLHALSPCDEVALATGDPPRKSQKLRYLIQSRLGNGLESQFVNVLEPYDKTPFVKQVRVLAVEHQAAPTTVVAVAVELVDGRRDILVCAARPTAVAIEGGITFNGMVGLVRLSGDSVEIMRMCGGTLLSYRETQLTAERAEWRGKVVRVDTSRADDNRAVLDPPIPQESGVAGRVIHFVNDLPMDTSYDIRSIQADGISTGDITLLEGFRDASDFAAGCTYLINPGDEYVVPTVAGKG